MHCFYCGLIVDAEIDEVADSDDRAGGAETQDVRY